MRKHWKRKMWLIPLGIIAMAAITGLLFTMLWNWIMPAVFGLGMITFWQAIGIFLLGKLLFGGFRNRSHWGMHRHEFANCYAQKHHSVRDRLANKS